MLPNPNAPAAEKPYIPKDRDFSNIDSLLEELNTPKEPMNRTPVNAQLPTPDIDSDQYPEGFQQDPSGSELVEVKITPEEAAETGEMIAGTIDKAFGFTASIYALSDSPREYQADPQDISKLSKGWAAVARKQNFKIEDAPLINVFLLMIFIYVPIFLRAKSDRLEAKLRAEIKEMKLQQEKKNLEMKKEIQDLQEANIQKA